MSDLDVIVAGLGKTPIRPPASCPICSVRDRRRPMESRTPQPRPSRVPDWRVPKLIAGIAPRLSGGNAVSRRVLDPRAQ